MNLLNHFEEGNIALAVSLLDTKLIDRMKISYLSKLDGNKADLGWTYIIKEDGKLKTCTADYLTYQVKKPYTEFIKRHPGYFDVDIDKLSILEKIGNGFVGIKGNVRDVIIFIENMFPNVKIANNLGHNDDPIIIAGDKLLKTRDIQVVNLDDVLAQLT